MQQSLKPILLVVLFSMSFVAGCATPQERPRILWPPPPAEPQMEFVGVYSSQGDFPRSRTQRIVDAISDEYAGVFQTPFGIVSDGQGKVYVSDRQDQSVKIFDFNAKTISSLNKETHFGRPLGLALDNTGNLYVADAKDKRVLVFSPQHALLFTIGGAGILERPAYIAINDRLGRIYVSDGKEHRIAVFDSQGRHLFFFGQPGASEGQFAAPQGLAIDRKNRLFVADTLNARIQVFDADGNFLYAFGRQGIDFWDFENPKDLAFDGNGNLYIIDQRKALLLTYTPAGKLLYPTGSEQKTRHPLGFASPASVSVDTTGKIFITDQLNKRFTIWQHLSADYLREHPVTEKDLEKIRHLLD